MSVSHKQRKNRMVIRRGGNFDLAAFRRDAIFRQHRAKQFQLFFAQQLLIALGDSQFPSPPAD